MTPIRYWLILTWAVLTASPALAETNTSEQSGILNWLGDWNPNQSRIFQDWRLQLGGWLNGGLSVNPNPSANRFNDTVTFGDRANEPQLNQWYVFLKRDANALADQWDWGGRLDFILGSDAFYTRSMGDPANHWDGHLMHEGIYGIAFPQAYLEFTVPVGNNLRVRLGEFYTLIGSETVMTAPDNFFYSHAYLMQYAEPFSHTGTLFSYTLNQHVALNVGAVTGSPFAGWDGSFQHRLENWGFLGSVNLHWQQSSLTLAAIHGANSLDKQQSIDLYSLTYQHDFTDNWHATLEHDYGWSNQTNSNPAAEWYGIAGYLKYDLSPSLQLGMRLEWFRDDDGARVGIPARHPQTWGPASNYYEATLGLNWQPWSWINIRPSLRYDHSQGWNSFNDGHQSEQILLMSDVIIRF